MGISQNLTFLAVANGIGSGVYACNGVSTGQTDRAKADDRVGPQHAGNHSLAQTNETFSIGSYYFP